jgi:dTDP-4-dehydrorhamnose reductase
MTSLVIGASGQVGAQLYAQALRHGQCIGTYCNHGRPGLVRLDLRDHSAAARLIQEVRPSVCFVPAGLTFVDYAEDHPEECRQINVVGIANLALVMAQQTGSLVLFSTEHVFSDGDRPRGEDEAPEPASIYAQSKVEAERSVRRFLPERHLILRSSWVFGPDPQRKNFFYRVRETLARQERLRVASDQHGQPTFGPDLARTAWELVQQSAHGIFHIVGRQYLSRLEWARMIAAGLGLRQECIEGLATAVLKPRAPRPLQVRLDRRKLLSFLGRDPIRPAWEGVQHSVRPAPTLQT